MRGGCFASRSLSRTRLRVLGRDMNVTLLPSALRLKRDNATESLSQASEAGHGTSFHSTPSSSVSTTSIDDINPPNENRSSPWHWQLWQRNILIIALIIVESTIYFSDILL